jgi:hypothetical protein
MTFPNLTNPLDASDLSPFTISLSQNGSVILSSATFFVPGDSYQEYDGIEILSITASNETIGAANDLTIEFMAEAAPAEQGYITLRTPVWATVGE